MEMQFGFEVFSDQCKWSTTVAIAMDIESETLICTPEDLWMGSESVLSLNCMK